MPGFPPDETSIKLWNEAIKDAFHQKAKEIIESWTKHHQYFVAKLDQYRSDEKIFKDLGQFLWMIKTERPTFRCIGLCDISPLMDLIDKIESMKNQDLSIFCSSLLDFQIAEEPLIDKWSRIVDQLESIDFKRLPQFIRKDWPHESFDVFIALNRFNLIHSDPFVKTESDSIKNSMMRIILFQTDWSMYDSSVTKFDDLSPLSRWWFSEIIILAACCASKLDIDDPPESFMQMASQMPHILSIVDQHQQPPEKNPSYATEAEIAVFEAELDFPPSDDEDDDGSWRLIKLRP